MEGLGNGGPDVPPENTSALQSEPEADTSLGRTDPASIPVLPISGSRMDNAEPGKSEPETSTSPRDGQGQRTSATHFTDFYNKHCTKILVSISLIDIGAAAFLFLSSPRTALTNLIAVTVVTFTPLGILFYFVEDKSKITVGKRIATLVVACAIPVMQFGLGLAQNVQYNRAIESQDVPRLRAAFNVVKENDYRPGRYSAKQIRDVLAELKDLEKKYPYHPKVLSTLGLAQFHLQQYENAVETFSRLANVSPNDASSHYYLGISLKKHADELEEQDLKDAGKIIPHCGSPTVPWNSVPPSETVKQFRVKAMRELEDSLDDYYESPIAHEERLGLKIARNLGWLKYQLSNGCSDQGLCQEAIHWHLKALGREASGNFTGDPKYVLALDNLGEIYRSIGNVDQSYAYLKEAVRVHQEMLTQDPNEAKNRDYRCVYQVLADYYRHDQRDAEAAQANQLGQGLF